MFFLAFISLFSLTFYIVRLNTDNKRFNILIFIMFTEEDGTTTNNEDRKEF